MRFLLLVVASVAGFAAFGGETLEPGKIVRERIKWRPVVERTVEDMPGIKIVEREPMLDRLRARREFQASRVESVESVCVGASCRNAVSSVRARSRGLLARLLGR